MTTAEVRETLAVDEVGQAPVAEAIQPASPRRIRFDLIAFGCYLVAALGVMSHLLINPTHRVQSYNVNDQAFFEWVLAHAAAVVTHGDNPFFTTQLSMPAGVNLMANTSILGLAIPMSPITLLFGPDISFAVLMVLVLTSTATAWYYVFSRHIVRSRAAAFIGGAFCGFAPGMIAHSNAHPNIVAQFLLPFIMWRALKLRDGKNTVRDGIVLGLLVIWQTFINEEILFVTALGLVIFMGVYALQHKDTVRPYVRPLIRGGLIAAAVAGVALAYPLYVQFLGPSTYSGLASSTQSFGADLGSFFGVASQSLGGNPASLGKLAQNAAEENTFFGLPLVVLLAFVVWRLRRHPVVLPTAVVIVVFGLLALGPHIVFQRGNTGVPGPMLLLQKLPLFNTVVPTRLGLTMAPAIGILLALAYDLARTMIDKNTQARSLPLGMLLNGLVLVVLLPIAPTPLPAMGRPAEPAFLADGTWRQYTTADTSLVFVPVPQGGTVNPMFWGAKDRLDFNIAGGYFLGPREDPKHPDDHTAIFNAPPRPTSILLDKVFATNRSAIVNAKSRDAARTDLRYWHASAVVLPPGAAEEALWKTTTDLLGFQPTWVDGVWLWNVRSWD